MIFSNTSNFTNEDSVAEGKKIAFVFDGATGLFKERISPCASDANWFANRWKEFMLLELDEEKDLLDVMKKGIDTVENEYMSFEGADKIISKPSSAVALVRKVKDKIEFLILGDCSLLVKYKNGEIEHLTLDELKPLDEANINLMVKFAKENGTSVIAARPLINDALAKTRASQNTKGGYFIVSDSKEAIDHAYHGFIDAEKVDKVFGFSDGMSQIFDTFMLYSMQEFVEEFEKGKTFEEFYNELYAAQCEDEFCNRVPRFKKSDDASAFMIEF